jgi:hypothetical protein
VVYRCQEERFWNVVPACVLLRKIFRNGAPSQNTPGNTYTNRPVDIMLNNCEIYCTARELRDRKCNCVDMQINVLLKVHYMCRLEAIFRN